MQLWERFTTRARRAVVMAQSEAMWVGDPAIGTEHLLLGLLSLGEGSACELLRNTGADLDEVASALREQLGEGQGSARASHELVFTPEAERVLREAYEEARRLRDGHVGTEHLLLALATEGSVQLARYGIAADAVREAAGQLRPKQATLAPRGEGWPSRVYDFHTHTFLSDGVLSPIELIRRAMVKGYSALGIADHVGAATMARVIEELRRDCDLAAEHWNFEAFPGVELTHVPAASIPGLAAEAKRLGASHVVVHGETLVEPVEPGTNAAAVACPDVDILAHPGLLAEDQALLAAENDIFIELTSKEGHSLSNGHVFRVAQSGMACLLNSDAHVPDHILTPDFARLVALGAGVPEEQLDRVLRQNPEKLLERLRARTGR